MRDVVQEEQLKFSQVFVSYTKWVVGGMLFASIFFLIYAGVAANYLSIKILVSILTTLLAFVAGIGSYYAFRQVRQYDRKTDEFERMPKSSAEMVELLTKVDYLSRLGEIDPQLAQRLREDITESTTKLLTEGSPGNYKLIKQNPNIIDRIELVGLYKTLTTFELLGYMIIAVIKRSIYFSTQMVLPEEQFFDEQTNKSKSGNLPTQLK